MHDWLDRLASTALDTIQKGCYNIDQKVDLSSRSLKEEILKSQNAAIISEIKFASPSKGVIRSKHDLREIAQEMEQGGVVGISVLTEPKYFQGDLSYISDVRKISSIPILMKDFILHEVQVEAAMKIGATVVLLIQTLYDRGYSERSVRQMIDYAHSKHLEVLLEVHTVDEFKRALTTRADMIGINNRDLKAFRINLEVTQQIISSQETDGRLIVSESGVNSPADIRFLKRCGAHAFLVGTSIIQASNIQQKVRELVEAF